MLAVLVGVSLRNVRAAEPAGGGGTATEVPQLASDRSEVAVLRHPLVAGAELVSEAGLSPEEGYRELTWWDGFVRGPDGRVEATSGAAWRDADEAEPADLRGVPGRPPVDLFPPEVRSLAERPPEERVEVTLRTDRREWDPIGSVPYQQALSVLSGAAVSEADWARQRAAALERRRAAGEAALAPLREASEAAGARVVDANPLAGTLRVEVAAGELGALLDHPSVFGASPSVPEVSDAGRTLTVTGLIDGLEAEDLHQTRMFWDDGYRGDPQEWIMLVEEEGELVYSQHVSFKNFGPNGTSRVLACLGSDPDDCDFSMVTSSPYGHSTSVASIIASDLTLGQDPNFSSADPRRRRSGFAPDAWVMGVDQSSVSRVAGLAAHYQAPLLNKSSGGASQNDDCLGTNPLCVDYNAMFEAGTADIKSNGNEGHDDTTVCRVSVPGAAIGVLPVAAFKVTDGDEVLVNDSSRGGTATMGGGRSITGLAGVAERELIAETSGIDEYKSSPPGFGHTSASTPAVTGIASLVRQLHHDVYGSAIDDPGLLYAALLLMGDRESEGGAALDSGFDALWGAGRLRARQWMASGLEGQAGFALGRTCVSQAQNTYVPIAVGTPLSTDTDYVKLVVWWYDQDHDAGDGHDKIDVRLQRRTSGGSWTNAGEDLSDDNKKRVFYDGPISGREFRVRLTGVDVDGGDQGCGADANSVYFAWVYEANDRNDCPTPFTTCPDPVSYYVRPEE